MEIVGRVASIWRYPVKSMLGEEIAEASFSTRGMAGDRAYALLDEAGRVVSAKNARKWPELFFLRATYPVAPEAEGPLRPARIEGVGGFSCQTNDADFDSKISDRLRSAVRLSAVPPESPRIEYCPDDSAGSDAMEVPLPDGSFFDLAPVHFITTATLEAFAGERPKSQFDPRRFRPNLVIESTAGAHGFVEEGWIGRVLRIGNSVRMRVLSPCPRCIMTTLAQEGIAKDAEVLRTIVQANQGNAGVYVAVIQPGVIRRGNEVVLSTDD